MITWLLEQEVFADEHAALRSAAQAAGHHVIEWDDEWWSSGEFPEFGDAPALFHGSLGNAARISSELDWRPGALCDVEAFHCSRWYPRAAEWLLHSDWRVVPAEELVANADRIFDEMGSGDRVFVRPDSPLKPFSGRVVSRENLTLETLDHGFYYDDERTPVIVAPVAAIEAEWRFVVASGAVVAGCSYAADGRTAGAPVSQGAPWDSAQRIAGAIPAPEALYVLDLCAVGGDLRLLELNPFSGADLYACDRHAIVLAAGGLYGAHS